MYFRGIAADSKFQEKMKGYLFSEGYLFTGFYGSLLSQIRKSRTLISHLTTYIPQVVNNAGFVHYSGFFLK